MKEFLFKDKSPLNSTCNSNLIHNKENKDVVGSLSSIKNQPSTGVFNVGMTSEYTEPLSRETGAFGARLTSMISPP